MSEFLTSLVAECIDDSAAGGRGLWRLRTPFSYQSDLLGRSITVEPGFITDYASVPRVPVLYWLLGDTAHKAAVLHDWLYHHHEVCDEDTADKVLLEAMTAEEVLHWRAWCIYQGVRLGGRSSWEEDGHSDGHSVVDGRVV